MVVGWRDHGIASHCASEVGWRRKSGEKEMTTDAQRKLGNEKENLGRAQRPDRTLLLRLTS